MQEAPKQRGINREIEMPLENQMGTINGFRCAGSAKRHTVAKVNACMKKGFCTGFDLSEQFGKGDLHAEVFQRKVMGMCLIVLINVLIYSTFSRFCMDRFRAVIF